MHAGMAGTYLLPDVVGAAHARDLLLTGRVVEADEALRLGLVSRVIDAEGFLDEVLATAAGIAATAPIASRLTKLALADGGHADLEACLQWEALAQPMTLATADLQEGIAAGQEKRAAGLRGRLTPDDAERRGPRPLLATFAFPLRTSVATGRGPHLGATLGARRRPRSTRRRPRLWTTLWTNLWTRPADSRWRTGCRAGRGCGGHARAARRTRRLTSHNGVSTGMWRKKSGRRTPEHGVASEPYDGGPVAALRRIAFLLERGPRGHLQGQGLPRPPPTVILPLPARRGRRAGRRRHAHRSCRASAPSTGRGDRRRRARGACPSGSPKLEEEHGGPLAERRRARSGRAARRPALPLRLVRRRLADRGDGVHRDRARPRLPRAHRPLAAAHRRPRAQRRAADPAARRRRRGQRRTSAARLHAAQGASRSTSSTTARSTRPTRCSAGSTCGWPACTPSCKMDAGRDDPRMIGAIRNPRTNVLGHCTGRLVTGNRGTRPQSAVRREGGVRGLRRARRRGRDQLAAPSAATRPTKLLELARDIGCLFSIDSDAHAPGQLDFLDYGCERAEAAGIDARPDRQHLAAGPAARPGRSG